MTKTVEKLTRETAKLGEGPCWHQKHGVLYWVDIIGCQLHYYNPQSRKDATFPFEEMPGTVAPYGDDELLIALQSSLIVFNPKTQARRKLCDFEADRPDLRSNDGKCDPAGRFWIGSYGLPQAAAGTLGKLYCLHANLELKEIVSGIGCSNGLAWDLSRKCMYYIDSAKKEVYRFNYDVKTGVVTNQTVFITFSGDMGIPDGMCIDQEGCLWIAQWSGWGISRFNPQGKFLEKISVPTERVTACTFGGANLNELYITTASTDCSADDVDAGRLYRAKVEVPGYAAYSFQA